VAISRQARVWLGKNRNRGANLKQIYKSFEIEIDCKKANGEWQADIQIVPRGIHSIVPVFGYSSKSRCRSAALELAKEHIDRIIILKGDYSEIETK
jgi:hypothetical protein